jgi:molecular chaperone GrpE
MEAKTNKKLVEDLKIGWQRCQADFENYKKRAEADKANWTAQSRIEVLEAMLPILENLDLAVTHAPKESQDAQWIEGIIHITRQLNDKLSELGISKINPQPGETFDHNFHEALAIEKNPKIKSGQIARTQRTGYRMGETVILPAKVVVSQ